MKKYRNFENSDTQSPFANIDIQDEVQDSTENNESTKAKKVKKIGFEPYFFSDLLENKDKNRDINKIKKGILPLLTYTVENKNFNIISSHHQKKYNDYMKIMINDISLIISSIFDKFPLELKGEFIDINNISPQETNIQLSKKIIDIYNDAIFFLRDF